MFINGFGLGFVIMLVFIGSNVIVLFVCNVVRNEICIFVFVMIIVVFVIIV